MLSANWFSATPPSETGSATGGDICPPSGRVSSPGAEPRERTGHPETQQESENAAAETSGDLVFLHVRQQLQIGGASSHQEPSHVGHQDHASGSDAAGTVPEHHRGVSGVPEVVWPAPVHTAGRRSWDTGVCETERRAGLLESSPAGRDYRLGGLGQSRAVHAQRLDDPGTGVAMSNHTRYEVAPEGKLEGQPSGVPQRAIGSDGETDHHHSWGLGWG